MVRPRETDIGIGDAHRRVSFVAFARAWRFSPAAVAGIIMPTKPTIIELDMDKLEDVLRRVEANELDARRLRDDPRGGRVLCPLDRVGGRQEHDDRSAAEDALRREDREDRGGGRRRKDSPTAQTAAAMRPSGRVPRKPTAAAEPEDAAKTPRKGHGRNGADAYTGAEKIEVPHESLQPGDPCPKCEEGTVYETNRPGVLVRLVGQAPVQAKVYYLQKLRCNLCGEVFTAETPEGVGAEKYDATAGSMIALLKYGSGMPFNRLEGLQGNLGIPLPASTQWDIVEAQAERIEPAFEELIRQAAQGDVVHNDDTTVKILEMMGERARQAALAEDSQRGGFREEEAVADAAGMFTTGIVSTRRGPQDRLVPQRTPARRGEPEGRVGPACARSLPPPIQMCDALSRNLPAELETILAHCLAHGRRQFVEVADRFPEECRHVLESLAVIYRNDALARERNLSPEERLLFHQAESGPTMEELHVWLVRQFERAAGGAQLGAGRGDFVPAEALGEADALPARGRGAAGQQHLRAGVEEGDPSSEECPVLQDLPRRPCRRRLHEPDPHLRILRGQSVRLPDRAGASRGRSLPPNPQDWMPWNYRQTLDGTAAPSAVAR